MGTCIGGACILLFLYLFGIFLAFARLSNWYTLNSISHSDPTLEGFHQPTSECENFIYLSKSLINKFLEDAYPEL